MPRFDVSAQVPVWQEVRRRVREMDAAFERGALTVVELAKSFAGLAEAMKVAMEAGGIGSLRFRAVVKALDLKTPRSALQRFLSEAGD